ncbi:hypothetical protein BV25DRAFT_1839532 [Artomyces pyxidatus]|uniref:Uncharacterized protein n=1 Tax=Artomyces pyxidatus TaxID=48021 RepID=A0ACB8SVW0_9AGAM|nr:hypothetical protein BV25DRAFT_1839532 [Artomyces pyxidatus]
MSPVAVSSPLASPSVSPAHSVSSSPTQSRRIHNRKGSMSAADPWGTHLELNMNPARTTSCKLTIVRVNESPIQLDEAPPSPQHRRHFGFGAHHNNTHRRHGSTNSTSSVHSTGSKADNGRMSFASSTFSTPGAHTGPGSRPGSPTATFTHGHAGSHRHGSSISSKPRLTPDQLVNLAHQSCHPRAAPSPSHSPSSSVVAAKAGVDTSPTSFTALPDDVYLPFVDRAAEVTALFTVPQPSARLLNLLAQTLPNQPSSPSNSSALLRSDPTKWSAAQLEFWIKNVDRDVAPDDVWVAMARLCILSHSELIWERIKGALGVPPELDSDDIDIEVLKLNHDAFDSAVDDGDLEAPRALPNEAPRGLLSETLTGALSPERDSALESSAERDVDGLLSEEPSHLVHELSIEPVFVPTSPPIDHDHPPTRPGAHRMHDISEDVRGESDDSDEADPKTDALLSAPREVIQGLRISTTPTSPGLFADSPVAHAASVSPPVAPVDQLTPEDHLPSHTSLQRSSSVGSYNGSGYAASTGSGDVPYDAVGERGPGNPLFPTSFARLALGPTLSANNPALRSPNPPPPPAFSNPHAIRAGVLRGRRILPNWAEGWDLTKHEYAVTGSEGSVGGP